MLICNLKIATSLNKGGNKLENLLLQMRISLPKYIFPLKQFITLMSRYFVRAGHLEESPLLRVDHAKEIHPLLSTVDIFLLQV